MDAAGEIVLIRLVEKGVDNAELLCSEFLQELPIARVLFLLAKLANDALVSFPVRSDLNVEVS